MVKVELVKHKKEFATQVKKIGSVRHPSIVPLMAYHGDPENKSGFS